MDTGTGERAAGRRSWVVLLYFYMAALVGLGFLVVGATTFLFGAKDALVPQLGVSDYSYYEEYPPDPESGQTSEDQAREARERAIDDRRNSGLDSMISGVLLAAVGAPVLVWHLKRARSLGDPAAPVNSAGQ